MESLYVKAEEFIWNKKSISLSQEIKKIKIYFYQCTRFLLYVQSKSHKGFLNSKELKKQKNDNCKNKENGKTGSMADECCQTLVKNG